MKISAAAPLANAIAQTVARDRRTTARASSPNLKLLARFRAVDESIISDLVRRYHRPLVRFALGFLRSEALAEEVVQDTWAAVVDGLASFEGRSSVESWIFRIVANRAKTRARREARSVPFSAQELCDSDDAVLDPTRFFIDGHWVESPRSFTEESPEKQLIHKEAMSCLERSLRQLPLNQRAVVTLRDVQGMGSDEVCNLLGIRRINQRVLLHRARLKLRRALEEHTWLERKPRAGVRRADERVGHDQGMHNDE